MECNAPENSPIFMCSGQSIGSLNRFQLYMHEDSEYLKAGVQCNGRYVKPGPHTSSTNDTTGVLPNQVPVAAALNVIGSEYHLMFGPGGDQILQISGVSHQETKTTHPCEPVGTDTVSDTFNLPLVISFSAVQPWMSGDHLSGFLPIEDIAGCADSSAEICSGCREKGRTCDYRKQVKAQWSLKRRVTDCTANVTMARGDVKLNGEPIPTSGEVPLGQGDVITTGRGARAQFDISGTAIMRVGPSSQMKINRDMCDQAPSVDVTDDLITGPAAELFLHLSGNDNKFNILGITVLGVRGSLKPRQELGWFLVTNAYAAGAEDIQNLDQITIPDDWPGGGRAVYMKSEESGIAVVKALRGRVRVEDLDAQRNLELKPGEIYRSPILVRKNPFRLTMLAEGTN